MSRQTNYIIYAFLLVVLITGAFLIISREFSRRTTRSEIKPPEAKTPEIAPLPENYFKGKSLYFSRCMSCHGSLQKDHNRMTLVGFLERWQDRKELYAFVRSPAEALKKNDKAREFSKISDAEMMGNPDLTDDEIESILDYIEWELNNIHRPIP